MATRMIRKQIYIAQKQDRKLKTLAAARGCTEAEVVRDALDRLPDPEGSVVEQLEAAGLLAPKPDWPDVPRGAELAALEAEVEAMMNSRPTALQLSAAVIADREGR